MRPKKIWVMTQWVVTVAAAFLCFLVRNPQATPAVAKFVARRLPTLPQRLHRKSNLDEAQTKLKQELAECALLFESVPRFGETFDIKQLQEICSPVSDKWALLYMLTRALKPALVVETGVAAGKSSTFILQALADNDNGFLVSVDFPNYSYIPSSGRFTCIWNPPHESSGYLIPSELKDRWELVIGMSCDILPGLLKRLGHIDLFVHDSEHTYENMSFEFAYVWPYIRPGGYLVADAATWNTACSDFAKQQGVALTIIQGQGFIRKRE